MLTSQVGRRRRGGPPGGMARGRPTTSVAAHGVGSKPPTLSCHRGAKSNQGAAKCPAQTCGDSGPAWPEGPSEPARVHLTNALFNLEHRGVNDRIGEQLDHLRFLEMAPSGLAGPDDPVEQPHQQGAPASRTRPGAGPVTPRGPWVPRVELTVVF
jgi:hypothetical protein